MEQRVGRVDRYFSQIERRLAGVGPPPDVKLHVGYPHVVASMERGQVERVIGRQKDVEALMDSPLAGTGDDQREIVAGSVEGPRRQPLRQPFGEIRFPDRDRGLGTVLIDAARAEREHYRAWYGALSRKLKERQWCIEGDGDMQDATQLSRRATLLHEDHQHEIEWGFDAALRRYVITLSSPPWFSGGRSAAANDDARWMASVRVKASSACLCRLPTRAWMKRL